MKYCSSLAQRRHCANRLEAGKGESCLYRRNKHTHTGMKYTVYPEWICSCRRASSDRWKVRRGWRRTWRPRRRETGCGTSPECLGDRSEGETTHKHDHTSTERTLGTEYDLRHLYLTILVGAFYIVSISVLVACCFIQYQVFFQTEMCSTSSLMGKKIKYHIFNTEYLEC